MASSRTAVPKAIAFDLDGCLWDPEMYELWGSGGSPFVPIEGGKLLRDRGGTKVFLLGDARYVLTQLATAERFAGTHVATASSCDEPECEPTSLQLLSFQFGSRASRLTQFVVTALSRQGQESAWTSSPWTRMAQ